MKTRIEASDLRHFRQSFEDRLDRREIVGLMKWRQWNELIEFSQHAGVEDRWTTEASTAMDHPMADAQHTRAPVH